MKRIVLVSLISAVFVACQDGTAPGDGGLEGANFDIVDGSTTGNEDFFFLPPLTSTPRANVGDRDPAGQLTPVARVCEIAFAADPTVVYEAGPEDDHSDIEGEAVCLEVAGEKEFVVEDLVLTFDSDAGIHTVGWKTTAAGLSSKRLYRIEVIVGSVEPSIVLGWRDVDPDDGPPRGTCKRSDAFCQFNNGSNLPIKTIVESAAVCLALDPDFDTRTGLPPSRDAT